MMNKKVDEEFKNIHDEYLLQCICTEMKDKIKNYENIIKSITNYAKEVIKEHNNGDYNVSNIKLAIKEHKENIQNILDIINKN